VKRKVVVLVVVLAAVLLLAAGPDVLFARDGVIVFRPGAVVDDLVAYVRGLADGASFTYGVWDNRSFLPGLGSRVLASYLYMVAAGLLALVLGPLLGMWLTAGRHDRTKDVVAAAGAVPDFVLALLLQIGVVALYKDTGFRLAHVATIDSSRRAVLLPVLVLTVVPTIYLLRSVSSRVYQVTSEHYILAAKARGLGRLRIYLTHVLPNVTRFLSADLPRVAGIILADFFIVDYLFNLHGITTLIFFGMKGGYRYSLAVNGLLVTVGLYLAVYLSLRAFVALVESAAVRT
jgi:peptide/nickel transport system permease protein